MEDDTRVAELERRLAALEQKLEAKPAEPKPEPAPARPSWGLPVALAVIVRSTTSGYCLEEIEKAVAKLEQVAITHQAA